MNRFYNGKPVTKANLLELIGICMEEGWSGSDLHEETEVALGQIYIAEYGGVDEDLETIVEILNSRSLVGYYHYPNANLQDVEKIISQGEWFFQEEEW